MLLLSTWGAVKSRAACESKAREDEAMENASPVTAQQAHDRCAAGIRRAKKQFTL